ncbi:hypothetical protein ACFTZB_25305 [Rhodococcus sp. NPDC057014]|uniref:hypothetical protein n=1 Tax=Rhodococcus sp. NPDC057014 TaxID=3346000 RepID=UPI003634BF43
MTTQLLSLTGDGSPESFYEFSEQANLGDGLPLIPPTIERVDAMLATVDRARDENIGTLGPRGGLATVEAIAANAVMAGCSSDYFPAVLAAVEAAADPAVRLEDMGVNTNPITPFLVINGPARDALGVNYRAQCFGIGGRANATIGRALRLVMINIAGSLPSIVSKSTHGSPMRYTMCIGEWDERNPWGPLHVQRGFDRNENCVTVLSANSFVEVGDPWSFSAESFLMAIANSMKATSGSWLTVGTAPMTVVLNANWADIIYRAGYNDLSDVKQYLWEHSQVHLSEFAKEWQEKLSEGSRLTADGSPSGEGYLLCGDMVPMTSKPENFNIIVAGGETGIHAIVCHGWAFERPATRAFTLPTHR